MLTALVALGATVSGVKTASEDNPDPRGIKELLPLMLVADNDGSFGLLDSETNEEDSAWELWFIIAPVSKDADQPQLNAVKALGLSMRQSVKEKLSKGFNLDMASTGIFRRIQIHDQGARYTRLLEDISYGGMPFWGFKVFLRVVEREAVS